MPSLRSVRRLAVTANVVLSSLILITLMMGALISSEMMVFTTATRRNIPEDDILHSHSRENFKSYIVYVPFDYFLRHDLIYTPSRLCLSQITSSS
jgi:hypothetical protein